MAEWIKRIDVPAELKPAFESPPRLVKREIWRHLDAIAAYTDEARAHAQRLVDEAHASAEHIRQQARAEAETQGLSKYLKAIAEIEADQRARDERAAPDAVELTLAILARVFQDAARQHQDLLTALTWQAVQAAQGRGDVVVFVSPQHLDVIAGHAAAWAQTLGQPVTVRPDAELGPGECLIQTRHGEIDGRIQTLVDGFDRVLRG